MPVATIDPNEWSKVELKTLEGAYVMVRPLPYGMKLSRRDKATKMYMEAGTPSKGRKQQQDGQRFELEQLNEWATLFDFSYCIGDHNLTDKNDNKLDLGSKMTFNSLNPKVGSEIERIISDLNEETDLDEDELEDFIKRHTSSSHDEQTTSENS